MPIYEYKCKNCGKQIEIYQKTSSKKSITCSQCGSGNTERLFSAPSVLKVANSSTRGSTCCGREERCETPPCSTGEKCARDR